jgi:hypothetical protein
MMVWTVVWPRHCKLQPVLRCKVELEVVISYLAIVLPCIIILILSSELCLVSLVVGQVILQLCCMYNNFDFIQ